MSPPPPRAFSPAELRALRDRVAEEREHTAVRIDGLRREFDAIVTSAEASNADDEHDPEGQTIGYERAQVSALLADATARAADLDRALQRLGDGSFGRCERCGASVELPRLLAAPTTATCIDCATVAERSRHRTPGWRG